MLSPGLALLLYGLARGGERGDFTTPGTLVAALTGAALVAGFVRRSLTVRHPLLDLRLLYDRTFAFGIGTLALFTCGYFGSMLLGPVYWQEVRGWSATSTGLLGVPVGLAVGATMQIASRKVDTVSPRALIRAGILVGSLGMALTGLLIGVADVAAWQPVGASTLMGVGCGMVLMPTRNAIRLGASQAQASSSDPSVNSVSAVRYARLAPTRAITHAAVGVTVASARV